MNCPITRHFAACLIAALAIVSGTSVPAANETPTLCSPLDYQVVQPQPAGAIRGPPLCPSYLLDPACC